jgi:predicted O-methyltransferase YrrM
MTDELIDKWPAGYAGILAATEALGFTMSSDILTCCLLKTLAASKPSGKFLELGTGTGLSAGWILDGMDSTSSLISVDNEAKFTAIAKQFLGTDERLKLITADGADWLQANIHQKFDYIFADTWHGKYLLLNEVLSMLNKGGIYIIDDMLPQPNWPEGHHEKVINLAAYLDTRRDLHITKQCWATGIIIAVKK